MLGVVAAMISHIVNWINYSSISQQYGSIGAFPLNLIHVIYNLAMDRSSRGFNKLIIEREIYIYIYIQVRRCNIRYRSNIAIRST